MPIPRHTHRPTSALGNVCRLDGSVCVVGRCDCGLGIARDEGSVAPWRPIPDYVRRRKAHAAAKSLI